jgi:hypothetical protein
MGRVNDNSRPKAAAAQEVLSAQAEALDELTVALNVDIRQVAEETTTLTHEKQKATTRVVVVLVLFQVLGEIFDASGEEGNLNLGGTGVTRVSGKLFDDCLFDACFQGHVVPFLSLRGATTLCCSALYPRPFYGNRASLPEVTQRSIRCNLLASG